MKKILTTILALFVLATFSFTSFGAEVIKQDARTPDYSLAGECAGGIQEIDLAIADFAGGSMIPVTTAINLGIFEKNCVKVNLVNTTGDQSKLLMTGKIDAISEPIELLHVDMVGDGYADIIVVRVISDRSTVALVTKSGAENELGRSASLEDRLRSLQGKRIAVNVCDPIGSMEELDPSATGTQNLRYLLDGVGLRGVCGTPDLTTIPGVDLENVVYLISQGLNQKDVVKVALSGEVDAAILPSPYHVTKGLRVVINYLEFPEVPGSALMVMREWYKEAQNRDTVRRMHLALQESTDLLMDNEILANAMIWDYAQRYAQMELSLDQTQIIYDSQKSFWSRTGTGNEESIGQIQWIFMSDLGLVVGLCGCPGTENSWAFGSFGGPDPLGEKDGYVLFTTPFHAGNFEGLITKESKEWNEAFEATMRKFQTRDPNGMNKVNREAFYDTLREALGGDSEGY